MRRVDGAKVMCLTPGELFGHPPLGPLRSDAGGRGRVVRRRGPGRSQQRPYDRRARRKGPNTTRRNDPERSMGQGDADKKAEKPERTGGRRRRAARARGGVHQGPTARDDKIDPENAELIEKVLRRENMQAACERVVRNGGAPGVDGVAAEDLLDFCAEHWPRIRKEILEGTYRPQPVRRVEIPKPGGDGTRTLGIPTVLDRMIQQAITQVLTPIFDPTFSDASFGFRPRRSAHAAVQRAQGHIRDGYDWVVDLDLERFFDRVNHDVLMARVARRIRDKKLLLLIRRYLQAGVMEGGVASPAIEGDAARWPALTAAEQHPARRVGQGARTTRAPLRPVRRRLQRLRAVQSGGRAGDGVG